MTAARASLKALRTSLSSNGAVLGLVVGYGVGLWIKAQFWDVPISSRAKGWLSLLAFLGGLTVLAIATR